jgi:hypothetical protein
LADVSLIGLIRDPSVGHWLEKALEYREVDEIQALGACEIAYRLAMYGYRRDQWGDQTTPLDARQAG